MAELNLEKTAKEIAEMVLEELAKHDTVEVVRCKDCRHFELQDLSNPKHNTQWCIINGFNPQGMDYCSYGEKYGENDKN